MTRNQFSARKCEIESKIVVAEIVNYFKPRGRSGFCN